MFGSRWYAIDLDNLAEKAGVRVICTDRPGMGGATPVPLKQRVPVWLETVRPLLKRLDVEHVALLTHSAGAIYTLNTLYRFRDILDSAAPRVVFLAPFVATEHSGATLPTLTAKLPDGMINSFDSINKNMSKRILPIISWSGGIASSVAGLCSADPEPGAADSGSMTNAEKYGVSEEVGKEIEGLVTKWFHSESTAAANEEILLCVKKDGTGSWGAAEDYEACVRDIAAQERTRLTSENGREKLKLQAYFSEGDIMIGKAGQKYFEQCWQQDGLKEVIEIESTVMPGTNHDTILADYRKGAVLVALRDVAEAHKGSRTQAKNT